MAASYRWKPIADLTPEQAASVNPNLLALRKVWINQQSVLHQQGLVREFTQKLTRRMAIEGGLLERAYTLDRGVTLQLVEQGINASLIPRQSTNRDPDLVAAIIQDHILAAEAIFERIRDDRPLTESFLKQLHALLLRHEETTTAVDPRGIFVEVPLTRGAYKTLPNNPQRADGTVHEYCPPEHVGSEMERLLTLHLQHMERRVAPEVEAAWLHHAFTQVHPFQDGNGRIARIVASYVFIKGNGFPLVLVDSIHRPKYIEALETADRSGDLEPLVQLFATTQEKAFTDALSLSREVERDRGLDQIADAAVAAAARKRHAQTSRTDSAKTLGRQLMELAQGEVTKLESMLTSKFKSMPSTFKFRVQAGWNEGDTRHYFRGQVIQNARKLEYFANPAAYQDWVRLTLTSEDQAEILVSLHVVGREFRGLLAISAMFFRRSQTDEQVAETGEVTPLTSAIFRVTYEHQFTDLALAFNSWINEALTRGLAIWQKGI